MGGTVPEGHLTRMGPGVWAPQRPMLPNFRSPSRETIAGLPLATAAAAVSCPRHSSQHRKSSTMDGDKKRIFLERMRASPFHNHVHHHNPKTKTKLCHEAGQLTPAPKGTSTGVEILTDDEIGLTCSNGLGPPTFFDLGGSPPMAHPSSKSRHFHPQQLQQQRYGFRSLSGDGRGRTGRDQRPLFASDDLDDSPLLMSSIDGVTTQAGGKTGNSYACLGLTSNDIIAVNCMILSSLHCIIYLSFCSFLYNGAYFDGLKLSVNDITVSQKGYNGHRKLKFYGWDYK